MEPRTAPRWTINVDGESAGGSFATKPDAERAARLVRENPEQKIEVVPKGNWLSDPTPAPAAPATASKEGKPPKS